MGPLSRTCAVFVCGALCLCIRPAVGTAQNTAGDGTTCAALLANDNSVGTHIGFGAADSSGRDTTTRSRADSASFGIGGASTGPADIMLLVGVHADEVRFASQPHLRVRLCWGGDTVRVVQRDNLPSPVVAGTTYRNVYIAVELIGRVNAECLANQLGVGPSQGGARQTSPPRQVTVAATSVGDCAFLGGAAGTGAQNPRPPNR
ncbi:MAG: hypothetical protein ACJ79X_15080 [Gemmatimonadaceae bacterium]